MSDGMDLAALLIEARREPAWPIWSLSSREQSATEWLEAHDEDGHDYLEDVEPEDEA